MIQKIHKQQRIGDKQNKKSTRQEKIYPCTFDFRKSPLKNLFHNTFKLID